MSFVAATVLLATSLAAPAPLDDVNAFIRFLYANERCPGVAINYEKTLEQVGDLGKVLHWDSARTQDKILVETRIAQFEYQQSRADFCVATRNLYHAYDPAYLRKVGVID